MKNLSILLLAVILATLGCSKQTDLYDPEYVAKVNAEQLFGGIDPNHNWSSTVKGSITITADADLNDVVKVQILTESPYFNSDAAVLNEVTASKGKTVTVSYDAPNTYTRLIAACVSSKGIYYIKGFEDHKIFS